jgi:hypothetical protein
MMIFIYSLVFSLFFCYDAKEYESKLSHPDYFVREFATWQLDNVGYSGFVPLLDLLKSNDAEVRNRSFEVFVKQYRKLNYEVIKKIQQDPNLEGLLFYLEPGPVYVSEKFSARVIENPELARSILLWGRILGVLSKSELFYFDPTYIKNAGVPPNTAKYYARGGLYIIRCRALGKPSVNDNQKHLYEKRIPLFRQDTKHYFPLIDIH